ncbi:MAG: pyruvate dehydrogenase (acetyl-transferring) E1 component subunit alpha [Spirochaetales bacterium]|nr:pyruvate dehydrogenase (acetyl-transferring) E1 component subunit alpha [Spirochaetales bacterium]
MNRQDLDRYTREEHITTLRTMQLIRTFEEKAGMMYGLRKIGGFCHLYTGQEAVAVGAIRTLDLAKDYVLTAYRDHGHALACGMDPRRAMAELFGKVTGCSRGKGGSMHFFDADHHFLGGNGIVGAQIPVAAGVAFAQQYRGTGGVTLCFFGDGAFHQGAVHESFNLARIWNLPVVYIVENNQWGMGTNWKKVSAVDDFATTASAYGMQGFACDGLDVMEVRAVVEQAVAEARKGNPSFIEARTYRYKGHSMSDPQKYRTREEIDAYRKRDAIAMYRAALTEAGLLNDTEWEAMTADIDVLIDQAVTFAEESPEPALSELHSDIYT